ncbi:hypothetical protein FNV43_RR12537 [Rhamnella rubrinervis]|uniref:Uncharacterized protein n=1 Tax=Rhamnella rubrinervis TaxID=2594499 RepID=A0A8K0MIK9_9ROSA|nr:hypothetical protein FNV43_RR12537 [Rhamnella rubrinervis]
MTQKDKSRTTIKLPENTFTEEGNNSLKKFSSEIGEIFSEKQKKQLTETAEKTKKDKSRTPTELQKNASSEEGNSSLKKPSTEIDDIFTGKKRKKPLTEKTEKPNNDYAISRPKKIKNKKVKGFNDDGFGGSYSRPIRKTQDGFTVYSEEELGLNKVDAGGTPLCPFDSVPARSGPIPAWSVAVPAWSRIVPALFRAVLAWLVRGPVSCSSGAFLCSLGPFGVVPVWSGAFPLWFGTVLA